MIAEKLWRLLHVSQMWILLKYFKCGDRKDMPFGKNVVKSNNEDMHKHSDDIGNNNVENVMLTV